MERYLKGRLVSTEEGNLPKAIYIHKKCLMWWGSVFYVESVQLFLLNPFQIVGRYGFFRYMIFCYILRYTRIHHVWIHIKIHVSRKAKTAYNLEWMEY
jgi:hypothetical protein